MDFNDLTQYIPYDGLEYDPEITLHNFRVEAYKAERGLRNIEESLETFDPECIYELGWGRNGLRYWTKLRTRKTSSWSSCYYAAGQDGSERHFRCADVHAERKRNSLGTSFHLGRFVFEDLLDYRASCIGMLEDSLRRVIRMEERFAAGEYSIARSREKRSSRRVNWIKEGF
jgi:hypothetical protein